MRTASIRPVILHGERDVHNLPTVLKVRRALTTTGNPVKQQKGVRCEERLNDCVAFWKQMKPTTEVHSTHRTYLISRFSITLTVH